MSATGPNGRKLAIEVQLAHLPEDEARLRTERLRAENHEVLWVTHHCNWVAQLPAVGLHLQQHASLDPRADDIGDGTYCWIQEGILTCDSVGEVVGGRRRPALSTFLDLYLEQRVRWAPRRPEQYGWALTTDWETHLEWQNRRIIDLENQVEQAHSSWQSMSAAYEQQRRELAEVQRQLVNHQSQQRLANHQAQEQLANHQAKVCAAEEQVRAVHQERQNAMMKAKHYQRENDQLRQALTRTFRGRLFLKRIGPKP